ncbi:uncharacterized protein [Watersipora subatra]|uniref:uncharacterized protein n=1 Tax=Watersipora subatra TaxID=2589382 RepID=UPI00355AFBCC
MSPYGKLVKVYSQDNLNYTYYRWNCETDSPPRAYLAQDIEQTVNINGFQNYDSPTSPYQVCPSPYPPTLQGVQDTTAQSDIDENNHNSGASNITARNMDGSQLLQTSTLSSPKQEHETPDSLVIMETPLYQQSRLSASVPATVQNHNFGETPLSVKSPSHSPLEAQYSNRMADSRRSLFFPKLTTTQSVPSSASEGSSATTSSQHVSWLSNTPATPVTNRHQKKPFHLAGRSHRFSLSFLKVKNSESNSWRTPPSAVDRQVATSEEITGSTQSEVAVTASQRTPLVRAVRKSRWSMPATRRKCLYLPGKDDTPEKSGSLQFGDSAWISSYRNKYMSSKVPFIDSHCHLDFLFTRRRHKGSLHTYLYSTDDITSRTVPSNFAGCLAVFCDPFNWKFERRWKALLSEYNVWGSFGVHPKFAEQWNEETEASLRKALQHPKVRALGEIGLDYSKGLSSFKEKQQEAFRAQLYLALELQLPLVIHCRDAEEDCWAIMTEILPIDYKIHRHCFTNTWEWARRWCLRFVSLKLGLTPLVTFDSARQVRRVAQMIPLDRLLLETDAPYFVPDGVPKVDVPYTHPAMAITVAAEVALLKTIPVDTVLKAARVNTAFIYSI